MFTFNSGILITSLFRSFFTTIELSFFEDSLSKLSSNKQARKSGASMSGGNKNINTHTNKNILTNIKQLSSYLEKHK
jgi:hypothetical protein